MPKIPNDNFPKIDDIPEVSEVEVIPNPGNMSVISNSDIPQANEGNKYTYPPQWNQGWNPFEEEASGINPNQFEDINRIQGSFNKSDVPDVDSKNPFDDTINPFDNSNLYNVRKTPFDDSSSSLRNSLISSSFHSMGNINPYGTNQNIQQNPPVVERVNPLRHHIVMNEGMGEDESFTPTGDESQGNNLLKLAIPLILGLGGLGSYLKYKKNQNKPKKQVTRSRKPFLRNAGRR